MTEAYQGTPVTVATPVLHGSFGDSHGSYDYAVNRWIPVSRSQVRGDGLAYAYAEAYKASPSDQFESRTHIHVVSLPSGADRTIYSGGPYAVIAWQSDGIYLVAVTYYFGEGSRGLWRLDPNSGVLTKLNDSLYFVAISGSVGWALSSGITPLTLSKVDLATMTTEQWAHTEDPDWIWFMGVDDSGAVYVSIQQPNGAPSRFTRYAAPNQAIFLGNIATWFSTLVTDSHGTWIGGADGTYLYSPTTGLKRVSTVGQGIPAGDCQ